MSYLVSARRYRPQNFGGLVGQDHVSNTLKNAIARGRVGHAYLFSGPRGVGKTSAARIFAKALNCEKGPTPDPCGECTFCREITEGTSLDLVEIDGASNRRIDEIRQLRENVRFVPSSSRYKIYIIDEVHMLTTEAFNALLKTLEEPPSHVIFVFATTEVNKVPQTIRSRCQQFVFKRIPVDLIVGTLKDILADLGIGEEKWEERALFWIARSALGSLRDAESILDQMLSYTEGGIRVEDVFYVLGMPDYEVYHRIAEGVAREDAQACLSVVDGLMRDGMEVIPLLTGLIDYYRDLYMLTLEGGEGAVDLPAEDRERMEGLLSRYSRTDLQHILTHLSRLYSDARGSDIARELFEVTMIRLVHYRDIIHPAHLVKRLEDLRDSLGAGKAGGRADRAGGDEKKKSLAGGGIGETERKAGDAPDAASSPQEGDALAARIIRHFSRRRMALAEFLKRARSFTLDGQMLTVTYDESENLSYEHIGESGAKRYIERELSSLFGKDMRLSVRIDARGEEEKAAPLDPGVTKVLEIFKGEIVPQTSDGGRAWD